MRLEELGIAEGSLGAPCVLKWPPGPSVSESRRFLCTPVFLRPGGLLLALPPEFGDLLEVNASAPVPSPFPGPFRLAAVPAAEEDESGEESLVGMDLPLVLADMEEGILTSMVPHDPVTDVGALETFMAEMPHLFPSSEGLLAVARDWIAEETAILPYHSAQEEPGPATAPAAKKAAAKKRVTTAQLADQVTALASVLPELMEQMKQLSARQDRVEKEPLPPAASPALPVHQRVSRSSRPSSGPASPRESFSSTAPGAAGGGPGNSPCKSSDSAGGGLSLLVSHLVAQGDTLDLGASSSSSISARGSTKREKLQQDLAQRSSTFFLLNRKMFPAIPVPNSVEEVRSQGRLSMVSYLERFGGYAQQKELGLVLLLLAYIGDALAQKDVRGAQEHLALAMMSVEQAASDGGRWDLAFLLALIQEPSPTLYQARPATASTRAQPFAPLVPGSLGSVTLAYVCEIDLLTLRRKDAVVPGRTAKEDHEAAEAKAQPKKRFRYPRKPKQQGQE